MLENAGNGALIVEGIISTADYQFNPKSGQPSKQEAIGAFINGTPVYLKESNDRMFAITALNNGTLYAVIEDAGISSVQW